MNRKGIKKSGLYLRLFVLFTLCPLPFTLYPNIADATGEIAFVRAPEQIPEGDDITILVSASAREDGIDRTLAIEFPESWKFKRAWRVEAGSDHAVKVVPYSEVSSLLVKGPGQKAMALADYSQDYDPDADGIVYFIILSTNSVGEKSNVASVKAALVERQNPDAPAPIDPKTKKPLHIERDWHMVFPTKYDFSFKEITSKRLSASIELERVPRNSRALVADGGKALATLHVRPELIQEYFQHSFSVQFWFRTNDYNQDLLRVQSVNEGEMRLGIGILGQASLGIVGKNGRSIVTNRAVVNDGAWHNLVLSKDSSGIIRIFLDAGSAATGRISNSFFKNIVEVSIGDSSKTEKHFSMDELRFFRHTYRDAADFERGMTTEIRDTSRTAFAVFHFDDITPLARSSIPETSPMYFSFDSSMSIQETTSPVALELVTLSAELVSPTGVDLSWQTASELGVKQYIIERRIGSGAAFEKVLSLEAKHGTRTLKRGQPIFSRAVYHASENLPTFKGDVDLYYRIAIIGFNDKELPIYTFPVKVDYAPNSDLFVEQNDPNPFAAATSIAFRLIKPESVRLSVFDMFGREITTLVNERVGVGRHSYPLDATGWPPGIYFYKVQTATATVTRKMVLLR